MVFNAEPNSKVMINVMSDLSLFHGPNAGYALELYERYRQDPDSVDAASRAFFDALPVGALSLPSRSGSALSAAPSLAESSAASSSEVIRLAAAAARLARFIRQRGHLEANVDPLGIGPRPDPGLELEDHSLTEADLALLPSSVVGGPIAAETSNALEAINRLRQVYSGPIGYEDEHIPNPEERYWLRNAAEGGVFFRDFDSEQKRDLLQRLTQVDTFEQYIHKTWPNTKRFSIEGTDMMVPMLDEIVHHAAVAGAREVVLGMAHRGRLNVLAHVLGKPYEAILVAFDDTKRDQGVSVAGGGTQGYSGDVKYHLGYRRAYKESNVQEMPITLVPNPSHLEFVNAVAEGHARAAQETRSHQGAPDRDGKVSLPILIHGDAAFPGQGIVAETLNLSRLSGYTTSGTIHIIANNQIGFTTLPSDGRSTLYASDLAKGFEIPIIHVNADDPLACIAAARMAFAYRARFGKDFLIDLIGYRRYGHNEGDAPEFTQPQMYEVVRDHPRVRDLWAARMETEGVVSKTEADALVVAVFKELTSARNTPLKTETVEHGAIRIPQPHEVETSVSAERLKALNAAIYTTPPGFEPDPKLESRVLSKRRTRLEAENAIEWGHAEALAFASILEDGIPIRLTGQDCERGTFGHRNAVLHDTATGARFTPLQALPQARAAFAIYNSPLSENAALGFEYGYCIHAPEALTLWEGQYGDFANGAQVIIDQFLVAGGAKWGQNPALTLLLPHGYEGGGAEHSSARLERFLQLASDDNIFVVNCTTAAQFFHVLRRQAALLEADPRPLVVMSPKYLLRHPLAFSSFADLAEGRFQTVIDDSEARERAERVTRLILCSGKVYVDLVTGEEYTQAAENVAVVRVEQLYPFPAEEIRKVIAGYPNLRLVVWMQEEPRNMGAWTFVQPRLREESGWNGSLLYAGRPDSASPAEGSLSRHLAEQARLLSMALEVAPPLDVDGWGLGARRTGS